MANTAAMNQFIAGLKSRSEDVRVKAANDLHHFVSTELREMQLEEHTSFMDEFNHHIFEMVSSSDLNERKGGILAIVSLIAVDVGNMSTRISRFANYLRNLLPSSDVSAMEMAAKAVGILAQSSGTSAADYVDFEVKRALEWLTGDRQENRRHAAVLVLKELAVCTPTFFFQQVQQFFDSIFTAIRDPKPIIREGAAAALRAALAVTSQRESKATQRSQWYRQCYDEAEKQFDELQSREKKLSRDDWAHGSLLIINELLRCSNVEGERLRIEMEEITVQQYLHEKTVKETSKHKSQGNVIAIQQLQQKSSPLTNFSLGSRQVPQKIPFFESHSCKDLMTANFDKVCTLILRNKGSRSTYVQQTLLIVFPRLAAFNHITFSKLYLEETINFLLVTLRNSKERTAAFQALGLLSISVEEDVSKHLGKIMEVLKNSLPSKDLTAKCGEFTCAFDDASYIRISDITVFPDKSRFNLCLRSSKMDPLGKGVVIKIFENSVLTPVSTMHAFVNTGLSQGATPMSPLFVNDTSAYDFKPLTHQTFISLLKETLTCIGVDHQYLWSFFPDWCSHSTGRLIWYSNPAGVTSDSRAMGIKIPPRCRLSDIAAGSLSQQLRAVGIMPSE